MLEYTFIYKRLYSRCKCSRACSNSRTVSSFFLASCKHAVATERADKFWFLSALIIHVSTCFLRKPTDSCSFAFFDLTSSISCNLPLPNQIWLKYTSNKRKGQTSIALSATGLSSTQRASQNLKEQKVKVLETDLYKKLSGSSGTHCSIRQGNPYLLLI